MGRNVATSPLLLDDPGRLRRRACRSRSRTKEAYRARPRRGRPARRAHRLARRPRRLPADGAGILEICRTRPGPRRGARRHGRAERRSASHPGRVWDSLAHLAALDRRRAHRAASREPGEPRAAIKPEALWEYDEGRTLTGMQTSAGQRRAQRLLPGDAGAVRALRRARAADRAGLAVRRRSCAGRRTIAGRADGHLPPLDGGRSSPPPSPGCRASACRSASARPACRWACS